METYEWHKGGMDIWASMKWKGGLRALGQKGSEGRHIIRVGLLQPSGHPRAHKVDPRLAPCVLGDAVKRQFEDLGRGHLAQGAEAVGDIGARPRQ